MLVRWLLAIAIGVGAPVVRAEESPGSAAAGGPSAASRTAGRAGVAAAGPPAARPDVAAPRRPEDRLLALYHQQWVSGDLPGALAGLRQVLGEPLPDAVRAEAALRLANVAEMTGRRRDALAYLDRVVELAGSDQQLARRADDWRQRIRSAAPLVDVRGPAPGSVLLRNESPPVLVAFRRAEKLLVGYHRVVVAPRLENIDSVLRAKRRALQAAVQAYQVVIDSGGPLARAAAHFRVGAMYHHLAEAVAFERPPELLPAVAQQLARRVRAETVTYLRRSLSRYRQVGQIAGSANVAYWRALAQREVRTLARVLEDSSR